MEGDRDPRGRGLPGPRAHADFDPAQILGFRDHGIPQGQIVFDDLPKVGEREIQIPEPRILVPGVLRRHGWENAKKIEEYIRNQLKEDQAAVQLSIDFDGDPFKG